MSDEEIHVKCKAHTEMTSAIAEQSRAMSEQTVLIRETHDSVEVLKTAFTGGLDPNNPGIFARVAKVEVDVNEIKDERKWFKRAVVTALVGLLISLLLSTFALITRAPEQQQPTPATQSK